MTLKIITADQLAPFKHGFFTRCGGASSGVFEGLNCGFGSSDQANAVGINRTRVAEAMDTTPDKMWRVHQTHSTKVVTAEGLPPETPQEADALVSAEPGAVLSILTADCAPVLFADREARVIGATHAGWRGARDGILESTLDAMVALGASREKVVAIIGPTISQSAYEVGPEFFDNFAEENNENSRFFTKGDGDRLMFDLPGYEVNRLQKAGVAQAMWLQHCTYSNSDWFFSYRRSVHKKLADYGRLISTIRL